MSRTTHHAAFKVDHDMGDWTWRGSTDDHTTRTLRYGPPRPGKPVPVMVVRRWNPHRYPHRNPVCVAVRAAEMEGGARAALRADRRRAVKAYRGGVMDDGFVVEPFRHRHFAKWDAW